MDEAKRERFFTAMIRFRKIDLCMNPVKDIHYGELIVLVKANEYCNCGASTLDLGELQRILHISKPAVSQIISSLERKGYVVRGIDSQDKRKKTVTVTPSGERILASSLRLYETMFTELFLRFGEEELDTLIASMNKMVDIYERLRLEIDSDTL